MSQKQRIHFLDFSRSVAILMMLQGHFISMTLESYPTFMAEVRLHGYSGSIWFSTWGFFRGLTAPLFFTISGAVFTFLLHKEWQKGQASFFQLMRVKKGLRRALSLLLIGYLLQLNLKYFNYYLAGHFNPHFLAFHILQCIGVGLFTLLFFTFLLGKLKNQAWLFYLIVAAIVFMVTPLVRLQTTYIPKGFPEIIQNIIQGPETGFSIFPWIGFVFLGAGFGHYLSLHGTGFKNKNVYRYLIAMGLAFYFIGWIMTFIYNGDFTHFHYKYLWAFDRAFFVAILLMLFTYLSGFERLRHPYFMAVGQETFAIYVIHAILLYGAVTGYGLRSFLEHKFNAMEAILGAAVFLIFFIALVQILDPIRHFFRNFRTFFTSNGKPSQPQ